MKEFVFKCDRCGTYYSDYWPNSHKYYVGSNISRLDLCPECREELESFMIHVSKEVKEC